MVKFKERRTNLIAFLEVLADSEYQNKFWKQKKGVNVIQNYADFEMVIHFFFDDTQLAEDAYHEIEYFLKTEQEAIVLTELTQLLNALLEKYGTTLLDSEYIEKPEWSKIINHAKKVLDIIQN